MPTVSVDKGELGKALGKTLTEAQLDELLFDFGLELDEVVNEEGGAITYKVDVGANRYDLLCLEGLARALLVFLGEKEVPHYQASRPQDPKKQLRLRVDASVAQVRPHCVAAVLRNVTFDQAR